MIRPNERACFPPAARARRPPAGLAKAALSLALVLALALPGPSRAERDVDGLEELIPHRETALEWARLRENGDRPVDARSLRADPPPLAPIRNCAEWEPLTGVLVRYPLGVPYQLLRDFDDHLTLHVVVSSAYQTTAKNNFVANGVDTTKVQWLVKPNDSIWVRDYGPWFVFDGNDDITIIDHVYNRPARPNDNKIPAALGTQLGIPVVGHDMWHTGGNYMTDGSLFSMSTDLVYDEAQSANGMTPAQVDALMLDYYGVTNYNVIDDIAAGGIHHIDTWGKFLDEETILIKQVWTSHYTWSTLEQRATLIGSLAASTGRNYTVRRVYCPAIGGGEPASYTNSLIANERIYVPLFNNATYDPLALQAYEDAAPGYEVLGYTYGGWLTDDALHCRAKGVMDTGMLRVAHVPVKEDTEGPVAVRAFVDDRSEAGLAAIELRYRLDGGSWTTLSMTPVGADEYEAVIPASGVGAAVDYYVLASDLTGREEGHPRPAPAGWHSFNLLGSVTTAGDLGAAGEALALDFRETAPAAAHRDLFLDEEGAVIPGASTRSHRAVGVPGTVDGLLALLEKHGTMGPERVIAPAISLARAGVPVTPFLRESLEQARDLMDPYPESRAIFFPDGDPLPVGGRLVQPALARTLERIADDGRRGFYEGLTARLVVDEMERHGGIVTAEDLAGYRSRWREPFTFRDGDYEIVTHPLPSSGGIVLAQVLGLVDREALGRAGFGSAEYVRLLVEAERLAYADRNHYLGDPDFVDAPVAQLVAPEYLARRRAELPAASEGSGHSDVVFAGEVEPTETTHYCVVDEWGNAVAVTTTLNGWYGMGAIVAGAGFLLNNEMDDFSAKPDTPNLYGLVGTEANAIAAGKRMLSSMTPTIVRKDGRLFLTMGSPGGSTIITTVLQIYLNTTLFGMNVREAVDAGRFHHQWLPDQVDWEPYALSPDTRGVLEGWGYVLAEREYIGRATAIRRESDGRLSGWADRRGIGKAAGI